MTDVIALLGAVGLGTVVGQWFGGGHTRREARAEALKALRVVEESRWSNHREGEVFLTEVHHLEAAALVAQAPRAAINHYVVMTTAAAMMVEFEMAERNEPTLFDPFASLVLQSANLLLRSILRPWPVNSIGLSRAIRRIEDEASKIDPHGLTLLEMAKDLWHREPKPATRRRS